MKKSNPWTALALLLLVFCFTTASAASAFRLEKWEQVVKTEAGEVRVLRGSGSSSKKQWADRTSSIHIGFIFMEPKSLFIPQYLDSSLIIFVHRGEVRVGWIYKDDLVEKQLKMGDILHITAGSTFYMVNTSKGQRLQVICSVDASESLGFPQSFFVGGGRNPVSVLAGFHKSTLSAAFNVPEEEIQTILGSQTGGPIVMMTGDVAEGKDRRRREGDRGRKDLLLDFDSEEEEEQRWSWRELLTNFMIGVGGGSSGDDRRNAKKEPVRSPDPYNLYDRDPDVKNKYGWSLALDEHDYKPLKHSDIGVYIVNLTAGSMLAPHVNPRAAEYGVVLGGEGRIEVVFPNGTAAASVEVAAGDVFWIPRYFPFCQIASRSGPMEFFGFTTSSRRNRPQFLVGARSVLAAMVGPEFAAAFGVPEKMLREVVEAQSEAVILPARPSPEPTRKEKEREAGMERRE
ncbi:LOW QUALITY PROTEIN: vicilin-like seed storage protein At2g28490 [Curcuma longa]|uniref:LOW QUALITY PROTEIN: vicilin-like seed storage protein At2g28490 n=1 Tax=Curcuma longa TaxID=136217 RepID=UPI003D9DF44F